MRLIDMHSHWGTLRGYPLRTPEQLAQQRKVWNSEPRYYSEQEMADYFRQCNVRAILDFGFEKSLEYDECLSLYDYAFATQRAHPDAILGNWVHIDPRDGERATRLFEHCLDKDAGFVGLAVSASDTGIPANDERYFPLYKRCIDARAPALLLVGYTGVGATLPGGGGVRLDWCHPRYIDDVAARFPDLTIIASRPAWPWQNEMIAILLHKPNVWYELHGWSPRYLTPELKYEIARRLRHKVMFGADYPLFTYERLVEDWKAEGFNEQILRRVFHENAEELLAGLRCNNAQQVA